MKATWIRILAGEQGLRLRPTYGERPIARLSAGDVVWLESDRRMPDGRWVKVVLDDGSTRWLDPEAAYVRVPTRFVAGRPIVLRAEPSSESEPVRTLRAGAMVRIVEFEDTGQGTWVRLVLPSGGGGWAPGSATLTYHGGSPLELVCGVPLIVASLVLFVARWSSGYISKVPLFGVGIGIGMLVHAWRVRADRSARRVGMPNRKDH